MKAAIAILFLLHASLVSGQVPEMSAKDSTLLRAIDVFLDSMAIHNLQSEQFVIEAMISKLAVIPVQAEEKAWSQTSLKRPQEKYQYSYELILQSDEAPMISNDHVALLRFPYRGRIVYMFFGAEYFVKYFEKDLKRIEKHEVLGAVQATKPVRRTLFCEIEGKTIHVLRFIY